MADNPYESPEQSGPSLEARVRQLERVAFYARTALLITALGLLTELIAILLLFYRVFGFPWD
jgi:hypothetical protein